MEGSGAVWCMQVTFAGQLAHLFCIQIADDDCVGSSMPAVAASSKVHVGWHMN